MIEILILLFFNSALCFGFWNACYYKTKNTKGVLWFIDKWAKGKWFHKPLCDCLPCMASFHSIYPYWTFMYAIGALNLHSLLFYPVYVLALSGLNFLIDRE